MKIEIINVSVVTKPTAKGSYQQLDIAFKNLSFQGKVEGRKIMSFGATATTFTVLAAANAGEVYDITVVKNDKGFNDWVACEPTTDTSVSSPAPQQTTGYSGGSTNTKTTPAPRNTYETPEERAIKQVYIVRQSSINSAVNILTSGPKSAVSVEAVLDIAKQLENYVFDKDAPSPETTLATMESDIV